MMNFKKLLILTLLLGQYISAQPIASAEKLGVEIRYWLQLGSSFSFNAGDFNNTQVEIKETIDSLYFPGVLSLPSIQKTAAFNFGIGAQIDRLHEIGVEYKELINSENELWSWYSIKISYRYLFSKRMNYKPFVGAGFDYSEVTLNKGYKLKNEATSIEANGAAKGFHTDIGYGAFFRYAAVLGGVGYQLANVNAFAIKEDGFTLSPGAYFHQFYGFVNMRFYF